jgi:hypothetical protein
MNTFERSDVLRGTNPFQEHSGSPSVPTVLQEHHSDSQTPPRKTQEPCVPEKDPFESFVDGAGI